MSNEELKPAAPTSPGPGGQDTRPTRQRNEKDEKDQQQDEKDREKSEKDEKGTRDPLSSVLWAIFLIMVGVILLAQQMGYFRFGDWSNIWQTFMAAAGVTLLLEAVLRLILPAYRRPVLGNIIGGLILLSIGLGGVLNWSITWPVILIAIGVAILLGGLFRGRL